jgi:site-specific DNA-methyltransferase (adenine-specific)
VSVEVVHGDCRQVLASRSGELFDSCVTDPPYHLTSIIKRFGAENAKPALSASQRRFAKTGGADRKPGPDQYGRLSRGFMGQTWDGGTVAFEPETWRAVYDHLKPGAHLVAFGGSRNFHRLICAIEDAGFEIRDTLFWLYGSGFPKSHNVEKAIDRLLGAERPVVGTEKLSNDIRGGGFLDVVNGDKPAFERDVTVAGSAEAAQWSGWGTALKPAFEPICLARKPVEGSVAQNVLKYGTGALNIDACRVAVEDEQYARNCSGDRGHADNRSRDMDFAMGCGTASDKGRWPANILTDGSKAVEALFPEQSGGGTPARRDSDKFRNVYGDFKGGEAEQGIAGSSGNAARFFFSAKAGDLDRLGSQHATIKPVDLMRWLCSLVTPPGGRVLDPFAGSGTTAIAAQAEGFDCTLIELEAKHVEDINRRLAIVSGEGRHRLVEINANKKRAGKPLPLFGEDAA